MIDLDQFKSNAQSHGICEMLDDWNNCKSKKQLIDLCLSARGIEYVADAIAQGWGISPDVIERDFPMFINGRYTRSENGYTTQIYCRPPEDEIKITTTATLIIGFKGKVVVDRPCELYLCNSDVTIVGTAQPSVYLYNSTIINDNCFVNVIERKEY